MFHVFLPIEKKYFAFSPSVSANIFYVTFKTEKGEEIRTTVPMGDYIKICEGFEGTLKLQGTHFVSFDFEKEGSKEEKSL